MNNNYLNLLVHPITKEKLFFDAKNNTLSAKESKDVFNIKNNIPILLTKDEFVDETSSNNKFSYVEHYQKDAKYVDYFEPFESKSTNAEVDRLNQTIFKSIPKSALSILDVGCGNGWLSEMIKDSDRSIISMDINFTNPNKVLEKYPFEKHNGLVADVFRLPIKDNSLDCIVASEIMEHVVSPKLFIEVLFAKLKKGGKLIITTPYNEKLIHHLCIHCNELTPQNAHIHSFNKDNIKPILPKNGTNKLTTFSNKFLGKLRINALLRFFPYSVWKITDIISNVIFNKPVRFMIEIEKK